MDDDRYAQAEAAEADAPDNASRMHAARAAGLRAFLSHTNAIPPARIDAVADLLAREDSRDVCQEVLYWPNEPSELAALVESIESQVLSGILRDDANQSAADAETPPDTPRELVAADTAAPAVSASPDEPLTEPPTPGIGALDHAFQRLCPGAVGMRPFQRDAAEAVLSGRDVLVVSATGSGKSLCFQLPPVAAGRPAIVVSPLLALMEDQVRQLTARGIPACFLGTTQPDRSVEHEAFQGHFLFVYMAPERLVHSIGRLQELHARRPLLLFAVDEAHVVEEWGHSYRREFRQVGPLLRAAFPSVPIVATTATVTPRSRRAVIDGLHMRDPHIYATSFDRPNLFFRVEHRLEQRDHHNLRAVLDGKLRPAIIYVTTQRDAETVADFLFRQGIADARYYHGDLDAARRRQVQADFDSGDVSVLVATVAFGMGINNPGVRLVVHYSPPATIDQYYQQCGRAGRDGAPAECVLLWPDDAIFKTESLFCFLARQNNEAAGATRADFIALAQFANTVDCRRRALLSHFGETFEPAVCTACDNCVEQSAAPRVQPRDLTEAAAGILSEVARGRYTQVEALLRAVISAARVRRTHVWWRALLGLLYIHGFFHRRNFVFQVSERGAAGGAVLLPASFALLAAEEAGQGGVPHAPPSPRRASLPELSNDLLAELRRTRRDEFNRLGGKGSPEGLVCNESLDAIVQWRPSTVEGVAAVVRTEPAPPRETLQRLADQVASFGRRHPSFALDRARPLAGRAVTMRQAMGPSSAGASRRTDNSMRLLARQRRSITAAPVQPRPVARATTLPGWLSNARTAPAPAPLTSRADTMPSLAPAPADAMDTVDTDEEDLLAALQDVDETA